VSIAIVRSRPALVERECEGCLNGNGEPRNAYDDGRCMECDGTDTIVLELDLSPLATLAHNLAIGAALCASWLQGTHSMMAKLWSHEVWEPGCGRRAP
jgi:hypothetical protein